MNLIENTFGRTVQTDNTINLMAFVLTDTLEPVHIFGGLVVWIIITAILLKLDFKEVNNRKIAKLQSIVQTFGQIYEYDRVMEVVLKISTGQNFSM